MKKLVIFLSCLTLFSCKNPDVSYRYPDNPDYVRRSRAGKAFSENDLVLLGKKKKEEETPLTFNERAIKTAQDKEKISPLWKASVQTVGALFPIEIIDKDSGSIISSWYQENPDSKERVKISVIIKGEEVTKENLHVIVYRQKKIEEKGIANWHDQSKEDSESGALSAKLIQERIIEKALKDK